MISRKAFSRGVAECAETNMPDFFLRVSASPREKMLTLFLLLNLKPDA